LFYRCQPPNPPLGIPPLVDVLSKLPELDELDLKITSKYNSLSSNTGNETEKDELLTDDDDDDDDDDTLLLDDSELLLDELEKLKELDDEDSLLLDDTLKLLLLDDDDDAIDSLTAARR
jgi:hypothetical protein